MSKIFGKHPYFQWNLYAKSVVTLNTNYLGTRRKWKTKNLLLIKW